MLGSDDMSLLEIPVTIACGTPLLFQTLHPHIQPALPMASPKHSPNVFGVPNDPRRAATFINDGASASFFEPG